MGDMKKVAAWKVKSYMIIERDEGDKSGEEVEKVEDKSDDNFEASDEDDCRSRIWNWSQGYDMRDLEKESISAHYMQMVNSISIFVVELTV